MDTNRTRHTFPNGDVIDAPDLRPAFDGKSGRAVWDERGNSIWEWQTQPGVFSREISPEQLERFAIGGLRLLEGGAQRTVGFALRAGARNARSGSR